jgi:hypothetical protein
VNKYWSYKKPGNKSETTFSSKLEKALTLLPTYFQTFGFVNCEGISSIFGT